MDTNEKQQAPQGERMIYNRRQFTHMLATSVAAACCNSVARAADYPTSRITAIVSLEAGGAMDVVTRLYGQKLSQAFGQPFVVENRGGAAGNLAAEDVARANPDGYTVLVTSSGLFAINPNYYKKLPFDVVADFAPIALYLKIPFVLVTAAGSSINSIDDLAKAAKKDPGKLTFSSTGIGSVPHLAGELFKIKLGIDLTHVPYKGAMAQATNDVMAGTVDFIFSDPSIATPLIKAGKLKAFGVSSLTRMPQLPDLPTIAEVIHAPDFEAVSSHIIAAPAQTPKAVIDKLHEGIATAFKSPDVPERITAMNLTVVNPPLGPEATKAAMKAESEKWGAVLERLQLMHVQ
jgi:tripartite-type tricarboxylate transporter receptor subunit TctC